MSERRDRIRVMLTTHGPGRNPFIPQLVAGLRSANAEVFYFSWQRALWGRLDVVHLHWVESLYTFDKGLHKVAKRGLVRLMLLRMRLTRVPLVQTIHNLDHHDALEAADARLHKRIEEQVSLKIYMSDARSDGVLIPHGHYRDWHRLRPTPPPDHGRLRVVTVGQIRKYKNLEEVVTAFAGVDQQDHELVVAGKARPTDYASELLELAAGQENIQVRDEFLSDEDIVSLIQSSRLVVLPYPEIYNSGVLFLALSVGRPVLVRRGPISLALQEEFGPDWIHLFDGELTSAALQETVASVDPHAPRDAWPPMTGRDWRTIGQLHVAAYQLARGRLRKR